MYLKGSDLLRADPTAHGLRAYDATLEVADEQPHSFYTTTTSVPWVERPVTIGTCQNGYGPDNFTLSYQTWDPASVEADHTFPLLYAAKPKNGQQVLLTVKDTVAPIGRVLFRGVVTDVNTESTSGGTRYNVTARSIVSLLNDTNVTFQANVRDDPISPNPRFNAVTGNLVAPRFYTVYELVQAVMAFKDAWNSEEFFDFNDIDWGGLDADPRCGRFVPSNVSFQDRPKGAAILELLQMAGNYSFLYIPARDGRGRLRVVEFNLACNRVGDEWDVLWAPVGTTTPQYASQYSLEKDSTEWSTQDTVNICRLTSSPVRFFSGYWMVPEVYIDSDDDASSRNVKPFGTDTVDKMYRRAKSPDGANYRFTFPAPTFRDQRPVKVYPVGLPLFPDWNIHEDWFPALFEVQDVLVPSGTKINGNTPTPQSYRGTVEWLPYTIGDQCARGTAHLGHQDNLKVYQAWYAHEDCPACQGTGWVESVYNNADNEPVFVWEAVSPSGRRFISPYDSPQPGERIVYTVTNYRFNPKDFGAPDPSGGLAPWGGGGGSYPLPWKNTCPFCRGVGLKPEYKIRNIESELFAGRSNLTPASGALDAPAGVMEYRTDPDATVTGPETWEDAQNRVALRQTAWVVTETPLLETTLPSHSFADYSFPQLKKLTPEQRKNKFDNPLKFTTLRKNFIPRCGIAPTDPRSLIVPASWTCEVPFTTITPASQRYQIDAQLGRVIFDEPQFIPCRKQFSDYVRMENDKVVVNEDGMLRTRTPGRGTVTADRYWRPTGFWRPMRAWMTFFYTRPNYYNWLFKDGADANIPYTQFEALSPEGTNEKYRARASIHDGRLAIEVRKLTPGMDEAGGQQYPTGTAPFRRR
jgi:hypothetical protein